MGDGGLNVKTFIVNRDRVHFEPGTFDSSAGAWVARFLNQRFVSRIDQQAHRKIQSRLS